MEETIKDPLVGLSVAKRIGKPKKIARRFDYYSKIEEKILLVDDVEYCGNFLCLGKCGLPRLIRINPLGVIEQASALLGVENVWSSDRWVQSQPWRGSVVLCEYDDNVRMWWV